MASIRFLDDNKPKISEEGNYKTKIIHTGIRRGKNNYPLLEVFFEAVKSGRQISTTWPIKQSKQSLLYKNLKAILQHDDFDMIDTETLVGLQCRIRVFRNNEGYLNVEAIQPKSSKPE